MNSISHSIKSIIALTGTAAVIMALTLTSCSRAPEKTSAPPERIGVYDSRAVAVAYVGSAAQANKMSDLKAQMKRARETGDTRAMAQLEQEGKAWQSQISQQGF